MSKSNVANNVVPTSARLDEMIEEATVDTYDEEEQAAGFFTKIEENLAKPFATQILGVEASVIAVEMDLDNNIKAVCEREGHQQRIALVDLPLPTPPPAGAEWIAAYRRWAEGSWGEEEDEAEE